MTATLKARSFGRTQDGEEKLTWENSAPWEYEGGGSDVGKARNVREMLKAAGLAWEVEKAPLYMDKGVGVGEELVKGFSALRRRDTRQVFDIVGKAYVPVQNMEAFEFLVEFCEAGGARLDVLGQLGGGRYVWGLADLGEKWKVGSGSGSKLDEIKSRLLIAVPHLQGKAFVIKYQAFRFLCGNTLMRALRSGGDRFRMAHRRTFDKGARAEAATVLGLAREEGDKFKEATAALKRMKLTDQDALDIFCQVYGKGKKLTIHEVDDIEEKGGSAPVRQLVNCYRKAPGADVGTGWGVLNAVTYYADHVASRTPDKRLTNAWFGKGDVRKRMTLDLLMA